jgi:hypothetical protein
VFNKDVKVPLQEAELVGTSSSNKQIKAAFTLPHLNKTAQCVATVIANKPPTQMPILQGLVNETATKTTSTMECHIKSFKDQLKVAMGKTSNEAKNPRGMGRNHFKES